MGELTVIRNVSSTANQEFVTIDGERVVSGRSVMSPADIVTPPDASAKITIPQTGIVTISPNSKMNLSFVNSSIAGELVAGEIIIETIPNTTINIFTKDGAITTPNRNEKTIVKISIEKGAARLTTLNGQAMFNNVLVPAGEYFPQSKGKTADSGDSSGGVNPLLIVGILGAVGAVALIALSASSNNGDSSTVSPTR